MSAGILGTDHRGDLIISARGLGTKQQWLKPELDLQQFLEQKSSG